MPADYDDVYMEMSRRGARVLALGCKSLGSLSHQQVTLKILIDCNHLILQIFQKILFYILVGWFLIGGLYMKKHDSLICMRVFRGISQNFL